MASQGSARIATIAALMGLCLAAVSVVAQEPGSIAAAHEKVLADETLQFEADSLAPGEPPSWLVRIFEAIGNGLSTLLAFLGPYLEIVFWVCLALLAGGVLFLLGREFLGRESGEKAVASGDNASGGERYHPAPETARALLAEADRLAQLGRFDEAVHVLLFRSIDDIDDHWPHQIHRAMTSREIAGLSVLSAASAQALARIVAMVERCRFAGASIDEGGFNECRAAYAAFAEAGARS